MSAATKEKTVSTQTHGLAITTPSPGPTEILLKIQLKYLIFQNSLDYF